jgi:hypothetical protein
LTVTAEPNRPWRIATRTHLAAQAPRFEELVAIDAADGAVVELAVHLAAAGNGGLTERFRICAEFLAEAERNLRHSNSP